MDEYSGRTGGRLDITRKRSRLVSKDKTQNEDRNAQFCNRRGCKGRLNYTSTQIGCVEKPKASSSSLFSSSGKEIIGNSNKTCAPVNKARKSVQELQTKISPQSKTGSSETSSVTDEPEVLELIPSAGNIQTGFWSKLKSAKFDKVTLMEVGSSSTIAPNSRSPKICQKNGLNNQNSQLGTSVSLASKSNSQGPRNTANASSLRSLKNNSMSDVLPSGSSSSELNLLDMVKGRNPKGKGTSSSTDKHMGRPLSEKGRPSVPASGISIYESNVGRKLLPCRDNGVASIRTQRSRNGNTGTRLPSQRNGNNMPLVKSPVVMPHLPQPEVPIAVNILSSSNESSTDASSSRSNDMDGTDEVLSDIESIEQDEELTDEQLFNLETNLALDILGFYDQHRDMRLDIDDMSYEELLALEEKMGIVSTALSEEALSKCLQRSMYQPMPPPEGIIIDTKCSICQEEYVIGNEVGRLECEHGYHLDCIQQWLRLKNWCPICKVSAAPPQSSSPP